MHFSPVVAGCMNWGLWGSGFSTTQYVELIHQCLDMGVDWFDHADIYGHYTTEEEFGNALRADPGLRSRIKLISKCGIKMITPNRPEHLIKSYDTSARHIIRSAERSLKNLATDHIDLLLIHRPDPLMDPAEIAEAVDHLKTRGQVLHFGVSNFLPQHMALLRTVVKLEANQYEFSAFHTAPMYDGTVEFCQQHSIASMSWSPLGGGALKPENRSDAAQRVIDVATDLGHQYGVSYDQILLAWIFAHPGRITPVLGTSRADRIKAAMQASSISLEREHWFMILAAYQGHEVP